MFYLLFKYLFTDVLTECTIKLMVFYFYILVIRIVQPIIENIY